MRALFRDADVYSIDIDGNDYHVTEALLNAGFRPKICVVEYNSTFGPARVDDGPVSQRHAIDFDDTVGSLYYGASITGWRSLFVKNGYGFVTVEPSGTNAFFIDPAEFEPNFVKGLKGLAFQENLWQLMRLRVGWREQFGADRGPGVRRSGTSWHAVSRKRGTWAAARQQGPPVASVPWSTEATQHQRSCAVSSSWRITPSARMRRAAGPSRCIRGWSSWRIPASI